MTTDLATKDLKKRITKYAVIGLIAILILSGAVFFSIVKNGVSLYAISGSSMEPTYSDKDSVVLKQASRVKDGDIVFFEKPSSWDNYVDTDMTLVKRIVAVPGDTLEYDGTSFLVNGEVVYNLKDNNYTCDNGEVGYTHELTEKEIFVFGDNASESLDSRRIFCDGNTDKAYIPYRDVRNYGEIIFVF